MHIRPYSVFVWVIAGCVDAQPARSALGAPTIIAVTADPPEAAPGEEVTYRAFVASEDGPRDDDALIAWSFCATPRPLNENGAVAQACARYAEVPLGRLGTTLHTTVPRNACTVFGSESPAGTRPLDPDATFGYYQPVRLALRDGNTALMRYRIRCAVANAPIAEAQAFARRYNANRAPQIASLTALQRGREVALDALDFDTPVAFRVTLNADARERYVRYDPASARVLDATERLTTRWFVSRGDMAQASIVMAAISADNTWHADASASSATLWLVVTDDRGGSVVTTISLSPAPLLTDTP